MLDAQPVGGPTARRDLHAQAPQEEREGGKNRIGEGLVRCGVAAAVSCGISSNFISYHNRIARLASQTCQTLSKLNFLAVYSEKMISKGSACYRPSTCFSACTLAMDGTNDGIQAASCSATVIPQNVFKKYYYQSLPKKTFCSFPKACLESCTAALSPWSHSRKIELATGATWTSYLLPIIKATTAAAVADTFLGAMGLEGDGTKESIRWVIGTAITATATATLGEAALIYGAYRTGYTVLRCIFGTPNRQA